jgi:hypothetical protein
MKYYLLKIQGIEGQMFLTYDLQGRLNGVGIDLQGDYKERTLKYVFNRILTLEALTALCTTDEWKRAFTMREARQSVTFVEFWDKYAYKEGKAEAQKVWDKMAARDQLAAFNYIEIYESNLVKNPKAKLLAKSYLRKQRWNDM